MQSPRPQEIYRHFKGNLYQILTLAKHSETGEQLVIYQALYGDYQVYARPLSMFVSPVDKSRYPDAAQEYRFEKVEKGQPLQGKESGQDAPAAETAPKAKKIPDLMDFLDADTYEKRLEILAAMRDTITNETLTTMAVACDIELKDGAVDARFEELKSCLMTLEHYECRRLRS